MTSQRRRFTAIQFTLFFSLVPALGPAVSGKPLSAERAERRWGVDDLQFSPDRTRVAFSVETPIEGPAFSRNIWVLEVASRELRQYTFSSSRETHPRWSPDGRGLAFLSNRSGSMQVHVMPLDGGESRVLTDNQLQAEMRVKGLARSSEFSWARAAEQTLVVYRQVVAGARSPAMGKITSATPIGKQAESS